MQMFGVHSPSTCWLFQIFLCKFYFSWGLTSFIPSLSKQVVSSHSPSRCWLFQFFLFLMEFHIFYTNTLQGCKFSLSIQMYGLHSPSRCWLLFFKSYFMRFHIFIPSLPKQAVSCHSPCRCLVYILQADVGFFKICCSIFIFHGV